MNQTNRKRVGFLPCSIAACVLALASAQAQETVHKAKRIHGQTVGRNDVAGDRPLTIGGRRTGAGAGEGRIIRISPNEVYAVGGFPYRGPRPDFAERQEMRKNARNAHIRAATSGVYGYGGDGLGGVDFDVGRDEGYNNPTYGGAYNRYVGYNGVPSNLAFGPSYAFRHLTGPDEDDDNSDASPFPQDYGYVPVTPSPDE